MRGSQPKQTDQVLLHVITSSIRSWIHLIWADYLSGKNELLVKKEGIVMKMCTRDALNGHVHTQYLQDEVGK